MTKAKTGRPSLYGPLLRGIRNIGSPGEWFVVRRGHVNGTAPSQLRKRYGDQGFDFRAVPDGKGAYNIEAAWNAPAS